MKNVSKTLLIASAIVNGILGILITFLPQETGRFLGTVSQTGPDLLIMQLLGATLFSFGLMNYMARGVTLGGIYGKPIVLGNLAFHFIAALELIRYLFDSNPSGILWIPAILFALLATGFIKLNFTSAI